MGAKGKAKGRGGRRHGLDPALAVPGGGLLGRVCKCRGRFSVGVPGAKPPAK